MFHEEKIVGGKLLWRSAPDGEWIECSKDRCWSKIIELQDKLDEHESMLQTVKRMINQYTQG
jgi:hypothetical protein